MKICYKYITGCIKQAAIIIFTEVKYNVTSCHIAIIEEILADMHIDDQLPLGIFSWLHISTASMSWLCLAFSVDRIEMSLSYVNAYSIIYLWEH